MHFVIVDMQIHLYACINQEQSPVAFVITANREMLSILDSRN